MKSAGRPETATFFTDAVHRSYRSRSLAESILLAGESSFLTMTNDTTRKKPILRSAASPRWERMITEMISDSSWKIGEKVNGELSVFRYSRGCLDHLVDICRFLHFLLVSSVFLFFLFFVELWRASQTWISQTRSNFRGETWCSSLRGITRF